MSCYRCGRGSLIRDDVTGSVVCDSCGTVQKFDSYETHTGGVNGPQGVFIRIGTSGSGGAFNYKEKTVFEANLLIDDITNRLSLSGQKVADVKSMIAVITDGDYGQGNWFPVLIGACAYVVVRRENKTALSIAEISDSVGCDVYELGRMITRVTDYLDVKLPEFDIVGSFEKVVRNLCNLGRIESHEFERMRGQGVFLIQCMIKWSLTTGRRSLPIVAAVLVLVAEVNGVEGVKIEDVARDVHAAVSTCRSRYRELLEFLVKVAQVLPWGKDVTVKNVVKNAPFVLRYMEMKSMEKCDRRQEGLECSGIDLGEVVSQCLRRDDFVYSVEEKNVEADDSRYFEVGNGSELEKIEVDDVNKLRLSPECLSMVYDKFLNDGARGMYNEVIGRAHRSRSRSKRGFELFAADWWNGTSELSMKVVLKQILEKNVGFDLMPPSFVNGCRAVERRRTKINAAKIRIGRIMNPYNADSCDGNDSIVLRDVHTKKRKREKTAKGLDWEDFIIETLLLHQVKEEEIEKGHYNALLDLHVFNSGIM